MEEKYAKGSTPDTASSPQIEATEEKPSSSGLSNYLVCCRCTARCRKLTILERVFRYADSLSWSLNFIALVASIGAGATLPLMTIILGSSIGEFNNFGVAGSSQTSFDDTTRRYA